MKTLTPTPTQSKDAIWRAMEQSGNSPDYIQAHLSAHTASDSKPLRLAPHASPAILASCQEQGNYA